MKSRKPLRRVRSKRKKPALLTRLWRAILILAGALFVAGLCGAYAATHAAFSSRAGRLTTWGAGAIFGPALESVPWWIWGCVAGLAVYLWWKHKLIISIVYGILCGILLAIGGTA